MTGKKCRKTRPFRGSSVCKRCGARIGGSAAYRRYGINVSVSGRMVCKRCGKCGTRSLLANREVKEIERTIIAMRNS